MLNCLRVLPICAFFLRGRLNSLAYIKNVANIALKRQLVQNSSTLAIYAMNDYCDKEICSRKHVVICISLWLKHSLNMT